MKSSIATRSLGVIFCGLVVFLGYLAMFPSPQKTGSVREIPIPDRTPDSFRREVDSSRSVKPRVQAEQLEEKPSGVQVLSAMSDKPDPNATFLERIESLPLDEANLETKLEVERRIKASEIARARLIYSESKDGKLTIAYAVEQPTAKEIGKMVEPYQMLLSRQTDPASQDYVDSRYKVLVDSYGLTDGQYRLLYAIIPEIADAVPILQYSCSAASDQDCMTILKQRLAPKPPHEIGVPFSDGEGQSSMSYEILPGRWRMDHLIPEKSLEQFYIDKSQARLKRLSDAR